MKQRLRKWKPGMLIGLLAAMTAVFVCGSVFLLAQRDKEGFAFAELKGDASLLEQISVTGILSDSYQRVAFASQGQEIAHHTLRQTMLAEEGEARYPVSYSFEPLPGTVIEAETAGVEEAPPDSPIPGESTVSETADQFALYLTDGTASDTRPGRIQTQITYQKRLTIRYYTLGNQRVRIQTSDPWVDSLQQTMVRAGKNWYAATLTNENCRGTGGIYDMSDQAGRNSWSSKDPLVIQRENLYPVDLKEGSVKIVFLGACAEKLALFVRTDGALEVRIIDPQTWRAEQTIPLPGWEDLSENKSYFVRDNTMILASLQWEPEPAPLLWKACVVDLARGAVVCKIEEEIPRDNPEPYAEPIDAYYDGETLYLLSLMLRESGAETFAQHRSMQYPYLIAYRGGQKALSCAVYSGEQEDWRARTNVLRQYTGLRLHKGGEAVDSD